MQFWYITPHGNSTKTYLFRKRLLKSPSMLLTHQTFVTFTKSKNCICVQRQKFIQRSQTPLSFDLNILFLGSLYPAEHPEWFEIRNLKLQF